MERVKLLLPAAAGASVLLAGVAVVPCAAAEHPVARTSSSYKITRLSDTGNPARWDPCVRHTYSVVGLPAAQRRLIDKAFRKASTATAMTWTRTNGSADITVTGQMKNGRRSRGYTDNPYTGDYRNTSATITVTIGRRGDRKTLLALYMHEIGHAFGLTHVNDAKQTMHSPVTKRNSTYGAGDKAGLARVGRQAGCLPTAAAVGNMAVHGTWAPTFTWTAPAGTATLPIVSTTITITLPDGTVAADHLFYFGVVDTYTLYDHRCAVGTTLTVAVANDYGSTTATFPVTSCPT